VDPSTEPPRGCALPLVLHRVVHQRLLVRQRRLLALQLEVAGGAVCLDPLRKGNVSCTLSKAESIDQAPSMF
jgi:hypothetical protein